MLGWRQIITNEKFDLTGYKYVYLEGIFKGTYSYDALLLNFLTLTTDDKTWRPPVQGKYVGFYIDITGNEWNNTQIGISPKMSGDAIRLMKFTNIKPDGIYIGALKTE